MSSYNAFHNLINKFNLARANQYMVFIEPPSALGATSDQLDLTKLFCESASIPPKNMMTSPVRIEHAHFEVPYGISYDPVILNFYLDEKFLIRDFFVRWHDLVYSDGDHSLGFYDNYVGNVTIAAKDKLQLGTISSGNPDSGSNVESFNQNDSNYRSMLIQAYPKTVGSVQFSATGQGEVATMQVEFVYQELVEMQ